MKWPHDDTASCKAFYGNPTGYNGGASAGWSGENLVSVVFPWHAVLAWDTHASVRSARVHRKCAAALEAIFADLWANVFKHDQKAVEAAGMHLYGGAFNYRAKRGLASLSVHAFGAALDFDPEHNGLGNHHGKMRPEVVAAFKRQGAVWGGDFKTRPDPMHFQFATI